MARRYRIEYRQPGLLGDELELATWLSDVKPSTAVRHYTVTRVSGDALLARARVLWGAVDVKTGRPIPLPGTYLGDLAPNTVQSLNLGKESRFTTLENGFLGSLSPQSQIRQSPVDYLC